MLCRLGAYHSGLEIHGFEISFGADMNAEYMRQAGIQDLNCGIYMHKPRQNLPGNAKFKSVDPAAGLMSCSGVQT